MSRVFARLGNVEFCVPEKPHIDYREGGHLFIEPAGKNISERTECDAQSLIDMAFATQLLGYAMRKVLTAHDINLYRINYQDNGNWAFLRSGSQPLMHIHLYGRAKNETKQSYGQALVFPDPDDGYYRGLVPVPDEILYEIFECMRHALSEHIFDMPFESNDIVFALEGADYK